MTTSHAQSPDLTFGNIHPSAIVDPRAQIADDVQIGPGCVIDGPAQIDLGCCLLGQVWIHGPVQIGRGNTLYPFVAIGLAPQDRKYDRREPGSGVVIGDNNVLRESVTIHRATGAAPTTMGSDNYLMANSHLGHDVRMGSRCTVANGALAGGHASIGDEVNLGGNAAVHQFCRVGRLSLVSGTCGVTQDVLPFCVVYNTRRIGSLNVVGLRRAGLRQHVAPLQQAFNLLYRRGLPTPRAVEMIQQQFNDDPLCRELAHFVSQSMRGITAYESAGEARPNKGRDQRLGSD